MNMLEQMMAKMAGEAASERAYSYDITKAKSAIDQLMKRMDSYDDPLDYQAGDIIEWKPGLRDCGNKFPAYGQPVFCYELLGDEDRIPAEKAGVGTTLDYEDMVFSIFHEDADSVAFFYGDSRRFRKYRPPSE